MQFIQIDGKNKKLILDVKADISSATTMRIYYRKPDGTSGYWTASAEGDRAIYYKIQAADLDIAGIWKVQPYVIIDDEETYGDIERFEAKENI
jgi:hypothetical protein